MHIFSNSFTKFSVALGGLSLFYSFAFDITTLACLATYHKSCPVMLSLRTVPKTPNAVPSTIRLNTSTRTCDSHLETVIRKFVRSTSPKGHVMI
jgi:hypothetical protein